MFWSTTVGSAEDPLAPPAAQWPDLRDLLRRGFVQQPLQPPQVQRRPPDRQRLPPPAASDVGEARSLDTTLNSNSRLSRQLQQVEDYVQREKWPEVVAALQQLLEGDPQLGDTFAYDPEQQWTSLQRSALERIAALPPGGRRLYKEVYSGVAAELLAESRRTGDLSRLVDVSRRFLLTPAGQTAVREIALAYFDRADYLAAVRWLERLDVDREAAAVRVKYALALAAVERNADAERVIAALAATQGSTAGVGLPSLRSWWEANAKPTLPVSPAQADWPVAYGNATHTGRVLAGAPLLLQQWSFPLTHVPVVREQVATLQSDLREAGRACIPATQAVVVGERLAVRTFRGVEVIDLVTGRPAWSQPLDAASPERLLSGNFEGTGEQRANQQRVALQALYTPQESGNYDQHPLTALNLPGLGGRHSQQRWATALCTHATCPAGTRQPGLLDRTAGAGGRPLRPRLGVQCANGL